jgi:hypothetical protein
MAILNLFVNDVVFPGELPKHAISEGTTMAILNSFVNDIVVFPGESSKHAISEDAVMAIEFVCQ